MPDGIFTAALETKLSEAGTFCLEEVDRLENQLHKLCAENIRLRTQLRKQAGCSHFIENGADEEEDRLETHRPVYDRVYDEEKILPPDGKPHPFPPGGDVSALRPLRKLVEPQSLPAPVDVPMEVLLAPPELDEEDQSTSDQGSNASLPGRRRSLHSMGTADTAMMEKQAQVAMWVADLTDSDEDKDSKAPIQRWEDMVRDRLAVKHLVFVCDNWTITKQPKDLMEVFAAARKEDKERKSLTFLRSESRMLSENSERGQERRPTTCIGKICFSLVLHPYSKRRVIWDVLNFIILTMDFFMVPLIAFETGSMAMPKGYNFANQITEFASTVFWTLDAVVSFFTGYLSESGNVEIRPRHIARRYVKSWFLLDLAIVLANWLPYLYGSSDHIIVQAKMIARVARLLRLARLMKGTAALNNLLDGVNNDYLMSIAGAVKFVLIIIMMNHYVACAWFVVARFHGNFRVTWVGDESTNPQFYTLLNVYFSSLHWAFTQLGFGESGIEATTTFERIFSCVAIVVSMVSSTSFISSITGAMTHMRYLNAQKEEQETSIRRYLNDHAISAELSARVWHFVQKSRITTRKRMKHTDIPGWKSLPEQVKGDIRHEVFLPILCVHPLFEWYNLSHPKAMHRLCKTALQEHTMNAGDSVFPRGGTINFMFFVSQGEIKYYDDPDDEEAMRYARTNEGRTDSPLSPLSPPPPELSRRPSRLSTNRTPAIVSNLIGAGSTPSRTRTGGERGSIRQGEWACEIALWSSSVRNIGDFRALAGCELIILNKDKFQRIAKLESKAAYETFTKYAVNFVEGFNEAGELGRFDDILFNMLETVEEMVSECTDSVIQTNSNYGSTSPHKLFGGSKMHNLRDSITTNDGLDWPQ